MRKECGGGGEVDEEGRGMRKECEGGGEVNEAGW